MSRVKLPAVPGRKLSLEASRRLYVQTDRRASYTGLPQAHVDAHEDILDALEKRHPGIRREAINGAPRHFDEPLTSGDLSHQQHMRREEGIEHAEVEAHRREMDAAKHPTPTPTPETRPASPAAPATGRNPRPNRSSPGSIFAGARAARGRVKSAAGVGGTWGLYSYRVIGWGIGLSVLLLFLARSETAGAGRAPAELLFGGVTAALGILANPHIDPLSPKGAPVAALAATPKPGPVGRPRTARPSPRTRPALTPLGAHP